MFRVGILTVSDKGHAGERHDASGPELAGLLPVENFQVAATAVVPDEREAIAAQLAAWCDQERLDLILTTGGTGLSPRDVTPEATPDGGRAPGAGPPRGHAGRRPGADAPRHALPGGGGDPGLHPHRQPARQPQRAPGKTSTAILPALPHALEKLGGSPAECGAP